MVRVWFGDESQGLQRDRQEFVLTIERPCSDFDASKRFYCEGVGFAVSGVTSGGSLRRVYIAHKQLPSVAIGLTAPLNGEPQNTGFDPFCLDIGIWNETHWNTVIERMTGLGFEPSETKLSNPHQKWALYKDPDGFPIRLTYTRPPVNTGKREDKSPNS